MKEYNERLSDDFLKLHGTKNHNALDYKVFLSRLQKYLEKNNCTINSQLYVNYLKQNIIDMEKEIIALKNGRE